VVCFLERTVRPREATRRRDRNNIAVFNCNRAANLVEREEKKTVGLSKVSKFGENCPVAVIPRSTMLQVFAPS